MRAIDVQDALYGNNSLQPMNENDEILRPSTCPSRQAIIAFTILGYLAITPSRYLPEFIELIHNHYFYLESISPHNISFGYKFGECNSHRTILIGHRNINFDIILLTHIHLISRYK